MIHSTTDGAVVTIELDRADKRNALNDEMLAGLSERSTPPSRPARAPSW